MGRVVFWVLAMILSSTVTAQVRVSKLVIKTNQSYDLGQSDILVADTLVMMDSSRLILNKLKPENFIRIKVAAIGNHCVIDGKGIDGQSGRNGKPGITPIGPCLDGTAGRDGTKGLDGTPGINLFLYLERVSLKGVLTIDISGGNGGRGGNGGNGGGGSPGTLHCNGGNGSNGGNAGQGGNGANGGVLTLTSKKTQLLRDMLGTKILVNNNGGAAGLSGKAGYHGGAGLGPSRKNGKDGAPGLDSISGVTGIKGSVKIEAN
jgi:hypothetical protein